MSENETIVDIVAELQRCGDKWINDKAKTTTECLGLIAIQFARRIEAAWKREREASRAYWTKKCRDTITEHDRYCSPVGNAAAMREALVAVKKSIDGIGESSLDCDPTILMASLTQVCARLSARIERALSAPARNCDLYASTTEALKAQDVAFNEDNFKNGECKLGCPGCDDGLINCKILWLFATAKERKGLTARTNPEGGAK